MGLRLFVSIAGLIALPLAVAAESGTPVAKFSGRNSGTTPGFAVEGAWLLDFQVNSEFPDLATTVISKLLDSLRVDAGRAEPVLGPSCEFVGNIRRQ